LFDYLEVEKPGDKNQKYVRIKESSEFAGFQDAPDVDKTAVIPYFNDLDRPPVRLKKPDFTVYNKVLKYMTVSFLKKDIQGAYTSFSERYDSGEFIKHWLSISINNNSGLNISVECYDYRGKKWVLMTDGFTVPFSYANEQCMFLLRALVTNNEVADDTTKDFEIIAKITRNAIVRVRNQSIPVSEKKLSLTYSPYQGWTLTKGGKLMQGREGFLIDEKGLYILEDGRRLDETMSEDDKALRLGLVSVGNGLRSILYGKERTEDGGRIEYKTEYDLKGNDDLLKLYAATLPAVVYQAFQINVCYEKQNSSQNPLRIGNNGKFYSIGTDETGIPIVVTQVGEDAPGKKKLVIAGPHGDERNAQRLIMQTQKHFIEKGPPPDTVLYFIPCLSPTMCFADARGIPKRFWEWDTNHNRPIGENNELTIPELHKDMNSVMRDNIQRYNGTADSPVHGVDANRDFYFALKSSKVFYRFVMQVTGLDPRRRINPLAGINHDVTVFMIHGYDDTKDPDKKQNTPSHRGAVYGQYTVEGAMGNIPLEIKQYIDFMTQSLFGYKNAAADWPNYNREYFYQREPGEKLYRGEWIRHLYSEKGGHKILAFDIELGGTYNEGVHGQSSYKPGKIENQELPFFDKQNPGFFVPVDLHEKRPQNVEENIFTTVSFYNFLINFFNNKKAVDDKRAKDAQNKAGQS
jgi:hypothetical protein